ncbi:MAG: capsular biosynthesis protein [Sneathiella sp.]|nr:capsular biosynthesis protein [Sneathiella sp.]
MVALENRSFLFLQTIASPFFLQLGKRIAADGHAVHKVNFNGGDQLFWHDFHEIDFRKKPAEFKTFITDQYDRLGITDIILFGDCRTWHVTAIHIAKILDIQVWVFEEGYLRPHWVTLETGGVNGNSDFDFPLTKDIPSTDETAPMGIKSVGGGLKQRITYDFAYNFYCLFLKWKFPHHKTHRPYVIWHEYSTWALRLLKLTWMRPQAKKIIEALSKRKNPVFLFPLQLDSDSQVRIHSSFKGLEKAIDFVIKSFAKHADPKAVLLIKNHPLDNGMINYRQQVQTLSSKLDISDRVQFIDGGDLGKILDYCKGVITINSTVGMTALDKQVPVMVLGSAIYALDGLTATAQDDAFWTNPCLSDISLYEAFKSALLEYCHINGNFYTKTGIQLAVTNSFSRLMNSTKVR